MPLQIHTPPVPVSSSEGSQNEAGNSFEVSTTFYPLANLVDIPVDLIIFSSDSVFFNVHTHKLLNASENSFCYLLPTSDYLTVENTSEPIVALPESATTLNILFHTMYGLSCSNYQPSLDELSRAIAALVKYGVQLAIFIAPLTPLFSTLYEHSRTEGFELYCLAASLNLEDLAVRTSSHLLSLHLPSISDDEATQMGPLYLKRLFFLHLGRTDALKRLLLKPPETHSPTPGNDYEEQGKLTRAWALASAYLAWDARPDMSVTTIELALRSLSNQLTCQLCKNALRKRTNDLTAQWSAVKARQLTLLIFNAYPHPHLPLRQLFDLFLKNTEEP